jgi:apolipoprotein N-acyltransferase
MTWAARLAGVAGWRAAGLSSMGGAIAALGQAPFDLWLLSPLGLSLVVSLVAVAPTARAALWRGLMGGVGYFGLALHWIVEPFFVDAVRHGWMAPFALVLFAGGMALFWSVAAGLSARVVAVPVWRAALVAPVLTLAEAARGTILTGFPWAMPGHALIDTAWLPAAGVAGAHGLTLIVMLAASALAACALARRVYLGLGLTLPLLLLPYALPRPDVEPAADAPVVRLIQPNAPQHLKWQPDMIPVFWQRGRDLTAAPASAALGPPDLVIWPETSLPVLLDRSDAARAQLSQAAGPVPVLIGAQRVEDFAARNSLALVGPDGRLEALYDKHHLVPFGEYLPLAGLAERLSLRALAAVLPGGYGPGPGPTAFDLGPDLGRAFLMICYEAIFPRYIRTLDARPDWMAHVTNDAWFGTFSGPWQHLALARLRAAEQGLPVLRAANTGVSAVIDARGHVVQALPLGEAGFLDAPLPRAAPPTIYARAGDLPILVLTLGLALTLIVLGRRKTPIEAPRGPA